MKTVRYSAAGGVLADGERVCVLLRPSRGEVRLPKGHIERGEDPAEAAVREVIEETGYAQVILVADLGEQTVEFDTVGAFGTRVHVVRDERYFLLRLTGNGRGRGEWEFHPEWMSVDEALERLTFEPEREWMRRAVRELRGS